VNGHARIVLKAIFKVKEAWLSAWNAVQAYLQIPTSQSVAVHAQKADSHLILDSIHVQFVLRVGSRLRVLLSVKPGLVQ
jgi:hypothetical protein